MSKNKKEIPRAKSERIWELDALRGLMILCVLCYHLYVTVDAFCIQGYYTKLDPYQYVNSSDPLHFWFDWGADGEIYRNCDLWGMLDFIHYTMVNTFFVVSGISVTFSRGVMKRSVVLLGAAYIVSLFTWCMGVYGNEPSLFIRFGVLQCYGYSWFLYGCFFEKCKRRTLLLASAVVIPLGYWLWFEGIMSDSALLYPFGVQQFGVSSSDYWPLCPYFGWFLIGAVLGRTLYRERKTLLPRWNGRRMRWLQTLGKYSGQIYFAHIFVYTAVFMAIGWILNLF